MANQKPQKAAVILLLTLVSAPEQHKGSHALNLPKQTPLSLKLPCCLQRIYTLTKIIQLQTFLCSFSSDVSVAIAGPLTLSH